MTIAHTKWSLVLLLAGAGAASAFLHACANSLLRNTTEAGLESALDVPLPTPTVKRHQ